MLRDQTSVDAVEMFDRASLRECEANEDMLRLVPDIQGGWGRLARQACKAGSVSVGSQQQVPRLSGVAGCWRVLRNCG